MNEMQEVLARLEKVEAKIDAVYYSAEKTRKYFLWTLIITAVTIVLPLLAMVVLIPYYVSTLDLSGIDGLMLQ